MRDVVVYLALGLPRAAVGWGFRDLDQQDTPARPAFDLGDAALIVAGGVATARRERRRVLAERFDAGVGALGDPEPGDQ